jgi:hypothetical protein
MWFVSATTATTGSLNPVLRLFVTKGRIMMDTPDKMLAILGALFVMFWIVIPLSASALLKRRHRSRSIR